MKAAQERPKQSRRCRNGPGEFGSGSTSLAHPFDGAGLVASFSFRSGRAFFRARFVSTPE